MFKFLSAILNRRNTSLLVRKDDLIKPEQTMHMIINYWMLDVAEIKDLALLKKVSQKIHITVSYILKICKFPVSNIKDVF